MNEMNEMNEQKRASSRALAVVLAGTAVLLCALYFAGGGFGGGGSGGGVGGGAPAMNPAFFFGIGAMGTVILAFLVQRIGRTSTSRGANLAAPRKTTPRAPEPPAPVAGKPVDVNGAAIQILSILQRQGRLIDFLQEDIRGYQDAQIGAAVRNVHEGCREALAQYLSLEPVLDQAEGSRVTLPAGFDAKSIRLTGNIGEPPFHGTLRHRGWRVGRIALPAKVGGATDDTIVAVAEVEIGS
ncbi:MAG: DUF2760 domain-containing protein [Candidatus Eisenbacteria bacterium]